MIKIFRSCKFCKKEFITNKNKIKDGRGKFCSNYCKYKNMIGKKPWNTGKKCPSLSKSKKGNKNPMWAGGVDKKESDKKYSQTQKGIISHRKARKKYNQKETTKKKISEWRRKKLKNNIHFKIKRNISNGIWCKLKRRGCKKNEETLKCLPYTIEQLKKHLEKLFKPGMSWDNYGKWHIDHIVPDSSYNYISVTDKQFLQSWSLKNLQPLWAIDNIRKSNKLLYDIKRKSF